MRQLGTGSGLHLSSYKRNTHIHRLDIDDIDNRFWYCTISTVYRTNKTDYCSTDVVIRLLLVLREVQSYGWNQEKSSLGRP
jgi:hypothetical protein